MVNVGIKIKDVDVSIFTNIFNEGKKGLPLVLVHGLGTASGSFTVSIDDLAANRPVYTFDLPGYGRSSEIIFSKKYLRTERQFVDIIAAWVKKMELKKFVLAGHNFGGFLIMSYAIEHPEGIEHLVLLDPWGIPKKPSYIKYKTKYKYLVPIINYMIKLEVNPNPKQGFIFLMAQILNSIDGSDCECKRLTRLYNATRKLNVSGKNAFAKLMDKPMWARNPIAPRINQLNKNIPLTFMFGSTSITDYVFCYEIKEERKDSFVDIHILEHANQDLHLTSEKFPVILNNICKMADGELPDLPWGNTVPPEKTFGRQLQECFEKKRKD